MSYHHPVLGTARSVKEVERLRKAGRETVEAEQDGGGFGGGGGGALAAMVDGNVGGSAAASAASAAPPPPRGPPLSGDLLDQCIEVVMEVREHQDAPIFNVPVDWRALGLDDYPIIVRRPMDLGTVLKRLQAVPCFYSSALDVDADIGLVWSNAMRYNQVRARSTKQITVPPLTTHDHHHSPPTTPLPLPLCSPPLPPSPLLYTQSGRLLRVQHSRGPQVHHRPANGASTQRSEGGGRGGEPSQPPSAIRGPSSTRWRRRRAAKEEAVVSSRRRRRRWRRSRQPLQAAFDQL